MRPLIHFHRPRRIASAMLFVWLFAVFASWANACLVQPADPPATHPALARGHHGHAGEGSAHRGAHEPSAADPAPGSDPAQEVCAEFCEAEQSIVAKPQPSKGEGAADPSLFPPAALAGWPAFVPGRLDPRWRPLAAPPPPAAPVAIAFLRLTL
jgi:hypothetical protein